MKHSALFGVLALCCSAAHGQDNTAQPSRFNTLVLSEEFHSEGASVADINQDGHKDVISGPYWYQGPDFRTRHAFADVKQYTIKGYSDHFFSFPRDFDGDGWVDILTIPIPGGPSHWHRNPADAGKVTEQNGTWEKHLVLNDVGNESPTLVDVDGDGIDDLVCDHAGKHGYAKIQTDQPTAPWNFIAISDRSGFGRFTHGLGVGDLNADGRVDLLDKDGWWEQGSDPTATFEFHPVAFAQSGGSQMLVYDFDGDGDQDVVSAQNAHGYGLAWFENRSADAADPVFVKRTIMNDDASPNPYGLAISQLHAVDLADIDGDGISDIVTGKRFWAHGGNDPGAQELPLLYWFRTVRTTHGVDFVPMLIDRRVGVGTQLVTDDIDGNGHPDIIVGNKLGTYVVLNSGNRSGNSEAAPELDPTPRHTAGTNEFRSGVRTTEPRTPEQERETFVLPPGFEVELVASEPQIAKPMNLAFDHRNRLWVTSSNEYPYPAKDGEGHDTIKVLEDTTGDGQYDKVTTFADNLNIPIGLYPYGDGVICFSIPNILFLHDTDGDGKADQREVLYGPFDTSRDTHGMCNAFTRGYDGWLYACHGFNNQSSVTGRDGNQVTMHSGNTFRMRLDGSRIEHFTHGQVNPFGLAFDLQGNAFTADCHTKPVTLLIQGGYYPSFGKPHDGIGFVPDVMDHLNGSTAIGGMALYNGGSFPTVYQGSAFGGNVMTSRINRNAITPRGGSIEAVEEPDFLISGDPWFRPVDLQIGPDGCLYVADFYNRIIGHYEVPLDHPGRDRHRGRIWRIKYTGDDARRDAIGPQETITVPAADDLAGQLDRLASPNFAARMLAADTIVDQHGEAAIKPVRSRLAKATDTTSQVHLLWVLQRLGDLAPSDLEAALNSSHATLRGHAFQMLAAAGGEVPHEFLTAGLNDPSPQVRRMAAAAMIQHPAESNIAALLDALGPAQNDPHLRHVIRMALRDHLQHADWFNTATASINDHQRATVLDLCLAIQTDFAGRYIANNLSKLENVSVDQLSQYLTFASRYCADADLASVVELARNRFSNNAGFQETLLRSIKNGRSQRGEAIPPVVRQWAIDLACHYLGIDDPAAPLPQVRTPADWTFVPDSARPNQPQPWDISDKRNSSDGQQHSKLYSSFPHGEPLTGTYRSSAFELPKTFSFYFAGHDGDPSKPLQQKNFVALHDVATGAVIQRWSPPRNDTAQQITWDSADAQGKSVYLELVDGDTAGAYAWIAVGRFSVDALNPSELLQNRRLATALVADFQLKQLKPALRTLLTDPEVSPSLATAYADALVALAPSAIQTAIAQSLSLSGVHDELRGQLVDALIRQQPDAVEPILQSVMRVAPSLDQAKIAEALSSDQAGAEQLIRLIEQGAASRTLLKLPSVEAKLSQLATPEQQQRIATLAKDLGNEPESVAVAIESQRASYLADPGNESRGGAVFKTQCAICHKVKGVGAEVGPNLDGIGSRGLDRVVEDVLAPNRNVDAAFRTSVILLDDGRVLSGLIKRTEGAQIILVDDKGKEIAVPTDAIENQKQNRNSPMPANLHEILTPQQRNDLFAYLLSLTS
ncbi:PVC-type heme-binding CxxCH protein [Rhodopirellula sp. MGV]|uniref:PVC-type heme-binding CxxCH protein n=1 Tax=Rhodopirellula sp. MGV TaxID=2023130 RepID=UPI000B969CBC|nr:PVC-type heme-binding CxxCH protein [Rhodopirellula sp. MGV]OYP36591.1 hypothetical protein CGZ80_08150 [Rhodopirellula sp. MGV]PNY34568.1 hypothetical protein C2E31_22965 [Rhodopirellula baltica]